MNPITNPTSTVRVLIVEDQIAIRHHIEDFLKEQPGFTVIGATGSVTNARTLIHFEMPDLLLLDIGLPDGTGFDLLEPAFPYSRKVIFLTAHQEHAMRAIRYGAIDYLLKPFNKQELGEALQRVTSAQPLLQDQINIALRSLDRYMQQDKIALRSQQCVDIVGLKEICYLQGDNGYTTVFLKDGKQVVTSRFLKEYEELLPGSIFLRIHQSFIVNERHIRRYYPKKSCLYLNDGTLIPVSDRKKHLIDSFFKFL
jgi:two-component system, LytTR family, response regulator